MIRLSPELKQISCKSKSASIEVNYYQSLLFVPHGTLLTLLTCKRWFAFLRWQIFLALYQQSDCFHSHPTHTNTVNNQRNGILRHKQNVQYSSRICYSGLHTTINKTKFCKLPAAGFSRFSQIKFGLITITSLICKPKTNPGNHLPNKKNSKITQNK